jgi:bla regulator protein BlaR1
MNPGYLSPLGNHLWQSTLFAGVAGLLTLTLRNNQARVRHLVWLAASCKFLIPISVLIALGNAIGWRAAPETTPSNLSVVMDELSQPFAAPPISSPPLTEASPAIALPMALSVCGFLGITVSWLARWRRINAAVRDGSSLQHLELPIKAVSSPTLLEPGVFGILRPVLLLPEGIEGRLSPAQLELIVAHEMCHVRRRDNLTAAIHMVAETIFWFHPIVWWIGKRLVEERERCCDEEVLKVASDPKVYAEGILNVCKFYLSSPLACTSGVSGSDLKKRIESIMANRVGHSLNVGRKVLLISAVLLAVVGPVAIGVLGALPSRGQSQTEAVPRAFEAASVKSNRAGTGRTRSIEPGGITYLNTTLGEFIAMAYGVKHYQIFGPDWIVNLGSSDRYDVTATTGSPASVADIKQMVGPLLAERFHLAFHRETRELPVFAMVIAKGGHRLKQPGDGGDVSLTPDGDGGFSYKNWSMDGLADWLTGVPSIARPVVDRTGLDGRYTFNANLFNFPKGVAPDDMKRGMRSSDASDTIFSALPEQLGLKLEPRKAPVEILVIDRADKLPTAN